LRREQRSDEDAPDGSEGERWRRRARRGRPIAIAASVLAAAAAVIDRAGCNDARQGLAAAAFAGGAALMLARPAIER
jgi:hypothetical protein